MKLSIKDNTEVVLLSLEQCNCCEPPSVYVKIGEHKPLDFNCAKHNGHRAITKTFYCPYTNSEEE